MQRRPLDILYARARLAGWTGLAAFLLSIVFILYAAAPAFLPLAARAGTMLFGYVIWTRALEGMAGLFLCAMPLALLSKYLRDSTRCPHCKARVWNLFFTKLRFLPARPPSAKCPACGEIL